MNLNFSAIGKLDDSEKGSGQVVGGGQQQHISKDVDNSRIILGIDPGTNVMGYGVLKVTGNKAELVVMGVIDMRRQKDIYLRLGKIFDRVTASLMNIFLTKWLSRLRSLARTYSLCLSSVGRKVWL